MTPVLILLTFIVGIIVGYLVVQRHHRSTYLATVEYWIFLPNEEIPQQDAVMTRMISHNPYTKRGVSPIGSAEGLVFSDVRLHIALVRKSSNPYLFRPDLFAESEVRPDDLAHLRDAQAIAKIRYVSEEPLKDKRHIQFAIHAAAAYAELGQGVLIYDAVAERFIRQEELSQWLSESVDATRPEIHTRVDWRPALTGGFVETKGLRKIGRKDLKTNMVEADERLLLISVLEETVKRIWQNPTDVNTIEVDAYDDKFRVLFASAKTDPTPVRVLRIQAI